MMSKEFTKVVNELKGIPVITLDSYDTLGSIWQLAYEQVGDYENIKIVMDNDGYIVYDLKTNNIVLYGIII